jgi:serine/threonine protein kinase
MLETPFTGPPISSIGRRLQGLPEAQREAAVRDLVGQSVQAIRDLHRAGVSHGDLSGENLTIDSDGSLRVKGFAQAERIDLGTESPDDVYALGLTLQRLVRDSGVQDPAVESVLESMTASDPSRRARLNDSLQALGMETLEELPAGRPGALKGVAESAYDDALASSGPPQK